MFSARPLSDVDDLPVPHSQPDGTLKNDIHYPISQKCVFHLYPYSMYSEKCTPVLHLMKRNEPVLENILGKVIGIGTGKTMYIASINWMMIHAWVRRIIVHWQLVQFNVICVRQPGFDGNNVEVIGLWSYCHIDLVV